MTKKAYRVYCADEPEYAEIVFAETPGQAKSKMWQMSDEFTALMCRRESQFDEYADAGTVPIEVLIAAGWRFEWHGNGCYAWVYADDDIPAVLVNGKPYCGKCAAKMLDTL
jgi:hypothetical protein